LKGRDINLSETCEGSKRNGGKAQQSSWGYVGRKGIGVLQAIRALGEFPTGVGEPLKPPRLRGGKNQEVDNEGQEMLRIL